MSYPHLLVPVVFATENRQALIHESWESELYKKMGQIIRGNDGVPIEINGSLTMVISLPGSSP